MDVKLVKKAIKGNEQAFEKLIHAESEKLYRTAFLYVRNKEDALDVVQETVCKAFTSISRLKNPEYFSTWLIKILIHTAYATLKKKKRIVLTGDEFLDSAITSAEESDIEGRIDLVTAVASLNNHYQTVIILFYFQGQSIKTISETMGTPEGTVKTYLRRAKLELKKLLEGVNQVGQKMV
ncbi:sigma-70 family RNA polymerase sigma factor [Rossellomorea sp. YZS02]|uniref:sigma-70 family RNA polymerase sigma factor n=1 Tax=Rossellomorea sp. YZS02 TaxID=3097358 RepID=UPI002A0E0DBF|nr:sigma-70 family RNA polymerase sigma factor [Rossellomorea sp. YZS02]MDX8342362.1 sigma-70 family RNA polymerase sigma factor [Rossellomorea sp. YZS02]